MKIFSIRNTILFLLFAILLNFFSHPVDEEASQMSGYDGSIVRMMYQGFRIYRRNLKELTDYTKDLYGMDTPLKDSVIIVTGATSGLGKALACHLLALGSHVILPVRRVPQNFEQDLLEFTNSLRKEYNKDLPKLGQDDLKDKITLQNMDLADLDSVEKAVSELSTKFSQIDAVVNNAGMINPNNEKSKQGYELSFAVNFLGSALFTELLIQTHSVMKIISVSSEEHRTAPKFDTSKPLQDLLADMTKDSGVLDVMKRYQFSKLAQTTYFLSLNERLKEKDKKDDYFVFDVCPGPVASSIASKNFDNFVGRFVDKLLAFVFQPTEKAALPFLRLLTDKSKEALSGNHFHMSELKPSREDSRDPEVQKWLYEQLQILFKDYLN